MCCLPTWVPHWREFRLSLLIFERFVVVVFFSSAMLCTLNVSSTILTQNKFWADLHFSFENECLYIFFLAHVGVVGCKNRWCVLKKILLTSSSKSFFITPLKLLIFNLIISVIWWKICIKKCASCVQEVIKFCLRYGTKSWMIRQEKSVSHN